MKYAGGLLFSSSMDHVAVIEKSRPARFAGKLFPQGGHVEVGETPRQAVSRECEEELGVVIEDEKWIPIAITKTSDNGELMSTFFAASDEVFKAVTKTEENVRVMETSALVLQCIQKPETVASDLLTFIALAQQAKFAPQHVVHFDRHSDVNQDLEDDVFHKVKKALPKP